MQSKICYSSFVSREEVYKCQQDQLVPQVEKGRTEVFTDISTNPK